jgi:hypothetical protein
MLFIITKKKCFYSSARKITLFLIICFAILVHTQSCKTGSRKEDISPIISSINLDEDIHDTVTLDLFNIAKDISTILLEKTSNSIVGNIYNVAAGDGYVFVGTSDDNFLFDRKGSFVKRPFKYGRGPGEIMNPVFYSQIRNNKIWFNDQTNRRYCISGYDIHSEKWDTIRIPSWVKINNLVIDSDTSIAYISRFMHVHNKEITFDFSFIRQKLNGSLLDSISFGESTSGFISFSLLKANEGGIFAMNPRGDSLTYIKDGHNNVIWRNYFKPIKNKTSEIQNITGASILYYSTDTLLLSKSILKRIGNSGKFGPSEFILTDRVNKKTLHANLFLKDVSFKINADQIFVLGDNKFCILLTDYEMLKKFNRTVDFDFIFHGLDISFDDNPFLLFGEFR